MGFCEAIELPRVSPDGTAMGAGQIMLLINMVRILSRKIPPPYVPEAGAPPDGPPTDIIGKKFASVMQASYVPLVITQ